MEMFPSMRVFLSVNTVVFVEMSMPEETNSMSMTFETDVSGVWRYPICGRIGGNHHVTSLEAARLVTVEDYARHEVGACVACWS